MLRELLSRHPDRQTAAAFGQSHRSLRQFDAGLFALNDWRVRPNVTLILGLRYEAQTRIDDHRDVAPRIGVAWGLARKGKTAKTVLRARRRPVLRPRR